MTSKFSVFGVISGPFLDHVGTMFVLILYLDQIELLNVKDWVNKVLRNMSMSAYFLGPCLDHVRTMFGSCLGHVWTMFGPYQSDV